MEKIIIRNESDLSMTDVLDYVEYVINQGRISNNSKNYCYLTTFKSGIVVSVRRGKQSDTFVIWRNEYV